MESIRKTAVAWVSDGIRMVTEVVLRGGTITMGNGRIVFGIPRGVPRGIPKINDEPSEIFVLFSFRSAVAW